MTTRPSALVVEDSRREREDIVTLLNGLGLEVVATSSPNKAHTWIAAGREFDLAVIDWDMSHSPDGGDERTSRHVLEALAYDARETLTVVYARNVMRVAIHDAIQRAHPAALMHDKAQGGSSLERRLSEILSARIGDLELDPRYRNHVRHVPTGRLFKHRAAFKLMANHPRDVVFEREHRAMWTGMDRFRKWLNEVGSSVTVVSLGMATHRYQLIVREAVDAADDRRTA